MKVLEKATVKVELKKGIVTKVEISGETLTAIQSCGTSRQGTTPRGRFGPEALSELARLGLIGKENGLTRRGSYAYLDIQDQIEAARGW
jgi:hypothetical protein